MSSLKTQEFNILDMKGENAEKGKEHIPRPKNCFMTYRQEKQNQILAERGKINNKEISKLAGQMWNQEPEEVKERYRKIAELGKLKHAERYPDYKYSPKKSLRRSISAKSRIKGVAASKKLLRTMSSSSLPSSLSSAPTGDGYLVYGVDQHFPNCPNAKNYKELEEAHINEINSYFSGPYFSSPNPNISPYMMSPSQFFQAPNYLYFDANYIPFSSAILPNDPDYNCYFDFDKDAALEVEPEAFEKANVLYSPITQFGPPSGLGSQFSPPTAPISLHNISAQPSVPSNVTISPQSQLSHSRDYFTNNLSFNEEGFHPLLEDMTLL